MEEIPPQQYVEYPRAVSEPRIRFEAIAEAWRFFTAAMGTWVLATVGLLILTVAMAVPFYGLAIAQLIGKTQPSMADIMLFYALSLPAVLFIYIGQAIGFAGMYNMALKQIQGHPISIGDFFHSNSPIWSHIGAGLIFSLAVTIGSMACYVPGFILGGLLIFTQPIIVHQKVGTFNALTQSWNMLKGQIWMAAAFYLVISLVAGAGAIACGIGILFSYPLYPLTVSLVYRDHVQALYGTQPQDPPLNYNKLESNEEIR